MAPGPLRKPPVQVVCDCTACRSLEFQDPESGYTVKGRLVHPQTRKKHRQKDETAEQAAIPPVTLDDDHAQIPAAHNPDRESDAAFQEGSRRGKVNTGILDEMDVSTPTLRSFRYSLFAMVCTLAAWLHLACGLSRAATGQVLKVLEILVSMAFSMGQMAASATEDAELKPVASPSFSVPHDVRTAMSAVGVEPNIIRSICCPKCYCRYTLELLPQTCSFRETKRSRVCGEELWTTRMTRGGPKRVPRRLYNTQDFESWLRYFLGRPGIEDLISKSHKHQPPSNGTMHSIWDSPAWNSLGDFTRMEGNLTFSYYIDWFNPFTNKIAGKSASCGAIILFCLNLPYDQQHLPENVFFAGITPPPKEPSMTTITAVSDPIVDQLSRMWTGKVIKTFNHPIEGLFVRVAILIAIGDLLAMRKALGFAGVASNHLCSFCDIHKDNIEDLDYNTWAIRRGVDVLAAAEQWRRATTKTKKKEIFAQHGVRWSSLHRLHYRDPVAHTMLGLMHNWIEGVLQHHCRFKWGLGKSEGTVNTEPSDCFPTVDTAAQDSMSSPSPMEVDVEILEEEIAALHEESQIFQDQPSHPKRVHAQHSFLFGHAEEDEKSASEDDEDVTPADLYSDSDDDNDDGVNPGGDDTGFDSGGTPCIFDSTQLSSIHACLSDAVIPTWMERPPKDLGDKSHGKLKADQWFTLFSVFLPLVLPEIWSSSSQSRLEEELLLANFHDLVLCTNIVCSYSVAPTDPDNYLRHYISYRQSSAKLFPNVASRPNHHYAMHNPLLMKFWGPLIRVSEFLYEQQNGALQKIKTNGHIWELDFTMLRQICRRGRLMALIRDSATLSGPFSRALSIMKGFPNIHLSSSSSALKKVKMPPRTYELILAHVNSCCPISYRHASNFPHPENAYVLSMYATPSNHFLWKSRNYSTSSYHSGNSSINFRTVDGTKAFGVIDSIWEVTLDEENTETYLVVSLHSQLSDLDNRRHPYHLWPGFLCSVVYVDSANSYQVIIQKDQIIGHVAFYSRPSGTYGIRKPIKILVDSLHRNR